jgi:hypothetical protein
VTFLASLPLIVAVCIWRHWGEWRA